MGNLHAQNCQGASSQLKESIKEGDLEQFKTYINEQSWECHLLEKRLNKRGDTALLLAASLGHSTIVKHLLDLGCDINQYNYMGHTVLDLWLSTELPTDDEILHQHFCPFEHSEPKDPYLSDFTHFLLTKDAKGLGLQRLILHSMKYPKVLNQIANCIQDLREPVKYRICGLLLQVCTWFNHHDNLISLLLMGVDILNFWKAPFTPTLRNLIDINMDHIQVGGSREPLEQAVIGNDCAEWSPAASKVTCSNLELQSNYKQSLLNLKLAFIQDWRADWNDGENPASQYRAGLNTTPESAILFIRAANNLCIIEQVIIDISSYRPQNAGGPDLTKLPFLHYLQLTGYKLNATETRWLKQRFSAKDMEAYVDFINRPFSLKMLASLCIRVHMVRNVVYGVMHLPDHYLPQELKDVITLGPLKTVIDIEHCF